ncbi:MAG: hypothetical protein ACO3RX_09715, partial [Chthoniobacterales bacterium]
QRTENPRVGGSIPSLATFPGGMKNDAPLEKNDHWRLVALMVAVQLLDVAVTGKLCSSGELNAAGVAVVQTFHYGSNFLLLLLLSIIALAVWRPHSRFILPGLTAYLAFALLHLVVNVGALLFSATAKDSGLASLWDVGAIGAMSILTFAACYWILDRATPGGAFLIPGRDGRLADPGLGDYIYLSFDTSTTFGPTLEVPVCRAAKLLMMLQVALSIVILTVLLSRAVNAVG